MSKKIFLIKLEGKLRGINTKLLMKTLLPVIENKCELESIEIDDFYEK